MILCFRNTIGHPLFPGGSMNRDITSFTLLHPSVLFIYPLHNTFLYYPSLYNFYDAALYNKTFIKFYSLFMSLTPCPLLLLLTNLKLSPLQYYVFSKAPGFEKDLSGISFAPDFASSKEEIIGQLTDFLCCCCLPFNFAIAWLRATVYSL